MAVNGEKVQRRAGCNILGDPLDAMVSLANARSRAGDELRAGDMHNTGTATNIYWVGRADLEPSCNRLNHKQHTVHPKNYRQFYRQKHRI
jgi:hypothetical protein